MSRNTGNKSAAPGKGSQLLTGILVGMVVGVGLAAGLAWFILKSPSPFVNKEQQMVAKPLPEVAKPAAPVEAAKPLAQSAPVAASGVGDGKPRFEFYKVLTDKQDGAVAVPGKAADKPQAAESKPAVKQAAPSITAPAVKEVYFLQAGSFSNADDAEKLKARLTLQGMEVNVKTVTIPDKGVWHRVQAGPYLGADEMNRARASLKQNGVEATPIRGQ